MKTVQYEGPPGDLGRFGQVQTGDVLQLTDAEAAYVEQQGDQNFQAPPQRSRLQRKITGDTTLGADDAGKVIRCNHSAPITVTLPVAPAPGYFVQIRHGDKSGGDNITVDPNGATIDGEAGSATITAELDSLAAYWSGAQWTTTP